MHLYYIRLHLSTRVLTLGRPATRLTNACLQRLQITLFRSTRRACSDLTRNPRRLTVTTLRTTTVTPELPPPALLARYPGLLSGPLGQGFTTGWNIGFGLFDHYFVGNTSNVACATLSVDPNVTRSPLFQWDQAYIKASTSE